MPPNRRRTVAVLSHPLERRVLLSTYYVAPNGLDTNPGTALDQPLKTIQAAAERAVAGDTVMIRGGTYRETIKPAHSGTASARITFAPYNNETVTVSGTDLVSGWSLRSG